ncbi:hypothetical protein GJW-30_1_03914 [Variibacter gotjawalensis]|uniref:Uncharacterized protein n=1 Tax=Variibacter gotjawalensis TaxID=1333996 RepID=A0A0S3PZM3_9BRAD|nr:DUF6489 family protein [Variibacter gotjawalensis]RZS49095.1 hypothetical protein EV661_1520 [Variibacter gotjawalensis]BAT61357.1 hypothetical protein GJW-30_1_03914 [Variibacter gotjawalensis]
MIFADLGLGVQVVKVTVEVDCTPLEARQFFGLPDVQPMQERVMKELEDKMMENMERYSPEGLMKTWFSSMPQNAEWFRDLFSGVLDPARSKKT